MIRLLAAEVARGRPAENHYFIRPQGENNLEGSAGVEVGNAEVSADAEITGEAGKRDTLKMLDPKLPSKAEVEEHELTHLPYRNGCKHCVAGRGKEGPHKKTKEKEVSMPEVHWDFMFLVEEQDAGNTVTIIVAKERTTKMGMSSMVPNKSTGDFLCRRAMAYLAEIGVESGDVTMKSDQEPAMLSVLRDIGKARSVDKGGRYVLEHSPVKSSESNGMAERYIQSVGGQVRSMKGALESRWGVTIEAKHPMIAWMVEYASYLLNRFEVGNDGKTAYERCKGKRAKVHGVEFGEAVW